MPDETQAAVDIQRIFRGHQERKEYQRLSHERNHKMQAYLDHANFLEAILLIQTHTRIWISRIRRRIAQRNVADAYSNALSPHKKQVEVVELCKENIEEQERAATTIQRYWNGHATRKHVDPMFEARIEKRREQYEHANFIEAVVMIQTRVRVWLARARKGTLEHVQDRLALGRKVSDARSAVKTIQRSWRCHDARKVSSEKYETRHQQRVEHLEKANFFEAVLVIQTQFRRHLARARRNILERMKTNISPRHRVQQTEDAATNIQRTWRGVSERKRHCERVSVRNQQMQNHLERANMLECAVLIQTRMRIVLARARLRTAKRTSPLHRRRPASGEQQQEQQQSQSQTEQEPQATKPMMFAPKRPDNSSNNNNNANVGSSSTSNSSYVRPQYAASASPQMVTSTSSNNNNNNNNNTSGGDCGEEENKQRCGSAALAFTRNTRKGAEGPYTLFGNSLTNPFRRQFVAVADNKNNNNENQNENNKSHSVFTRASPSTTTSQGGSYSSPSSSRTSYNNRDQQHSPPSCSSSSMSPTGFFVRSLEEAIPNNPYSSSNSGITNFQSLISSSNDNDNETTTNPLSSSNTIAHFVAKLIRQCGGSFSVPNRPQLPKEIALSALIDCCGSDKLPVIIEVWENVTPFSTNDGDNNNNNNENGSSAGGAISAEQLALIMHGLRSLFQLSSQC